MNEMQDLTKLPYAKWLEEYLTNVVGMPVESICIMTKFGNGGIGTSYYECSVSDKILFSGYLQQDAMIDSLKANGLVEEDEDDEIDEEAEEE